ncbi:MAG: MATE family efflux transporter [Actinomycetota bacterium]|nr:MATE family efflux transporter [Actinomycetota bacterium]
MDPTDRRIVRLAVPALGSLAVEPLYVLVDTAIVGRLGTPQLGGLALSASVLALVVAGCNFLTYGTTERVARRIGEGRHGDAADVGVQAVWLAMLVGVVVAPLLAAGAPWIARLLGGRGDVLDFAVTYLRISAIGIPFVVFTLAAQGVQRGASDYRTPLVVLFAANLVNTVLEVLFVFGFGWGVPGSAWSTVIAQVGAGIAFAAVLRRHLRPARVRRPSRVGMAPLLTAGRHLLLRVGSMLAVFTGATAIAARTDAPTLAAHQVAASTFFLLALVLDALAIPAQTLVAEALGRRTAAGAARIADRCMRLSVIAGVGLAAPLLVLAPFLPHAFSGDPEVVARATGALWWLAALLVPGAVAFAYDGVLIGAGDYRFLGFAALGYLVVVIPFAALILLGDGDRTPGIGAIWAVLTGWMVLRAFVNHHRARRLLGVARSTG